VGFLPVFFPPEPGFPQRSVGRLPLPAYRAQLGTRFDQNRPDPGQYTVSAPALEPAVHRAVITELLGQLVPLAARAEAEDDAIERLAPVDPWPTAMGAGSRRRVFEQDRLDALPEFVVNFPDRIESLSL
jgi:hypothetical protein